MTAQIRLRARDGWHWWLPVVVAVVPRALLLDAPSYGDEGAHYAIAAWALRLDIGIHWLHGDFPATLLPFVINRPLAYLTWGLGSVAGFEGLRFLTLLLSVGQVGLTAVLVHRITRSKAWAWVAGLLLALLPSHVIWSTRIFPDSILAVLGLLAMLAVLDRRWRTAILLAVAAAWAKEIGVLVLAAVALAWLVGEFPKRKQVLAWTAVAAAVSVAPVLIATLGMGLKTPGWAQGGSLLVILDGAWISAWFAPLLVASLWTRARWVGAASLIQGAGYAAAHLILGTQLQSWYWVLPQALTLAAVVGTTAIWAKRLARAGHGQPLGRQGLRFLAPALVCCLVVLPAGAPGKPLVQPAVQDPSQNLVEAIHGRLLEGADLQEALRGMHGQEVVRLVAVDQLWYDIFHPIASHQWSTHWTWTGWLNASVERAELMAFMQPGTGILALRHAQGETAFTLAARAAYQECIVHDGPDQVAIVLGLCDRLEERNRRFEQALVAELGAIGLPPSPGSSTAGIKQ